MAAVTFVFVHGSGSNSFTWAPLMRELTLRGRRALAVDLPGHGFGAGFPVSYQAPQDLAAFATAPSTVANVTTADTVEHTIDVLRRARDHGPVTLVGHSRGGLTLTGVANKEPDLVDRLVYISAWCCVDRTVGEYMATPEHATSALTDTAGVLAGNPAELGVLRMNWRTADPALLAALRKALLADGTEQEFLAYLNTLEPDESLHSGEEKVDPGTWGKIPHSYIRLAGDMSIPVAVQDLFIQEADALVPDNPFDVHTLDSSHVRFLVHPAEAATVLDRLAG
jgi:pimeloyl-ACP methyl ester carboxylesterase